MCYTHKINTHTYTHTYTHDGMLFILKKGGNSVMCYTKDKTWGHNASKKKTNSLWFHSDILKGQNHKDKKCNGSF